MKPIDQFGSFQLDVLREIGNIGAGNATTALSRLLNKPVDMKVPQVHVVEFEEITDSLGGAEEVVIGIFLKIEGDAPGNMFFIFKQEAAKRLLSNISVIDSDKDGEFSELELSALCEVGNIMAGSYLSALADFTHLSMLPSVPMLAIDMAGAIVGYGLIKLGEMGDHALLIDAEITQEGQLLEGHFFLIPDPESFQRIFNALGVPLE